MRKLVLFLSFFAFAFASGEEFHVVEGEDYKYVNISLTDVNRIVCSSEITRVVYSKEKNLEVKKDGRNAWVKILPVKEGEVLKYSPQPMELYVECGGRIFSLILLPKRIPATTIVLKVPYEDRKRAREFEAKANSYERLITSLIEHAYKEEPPPGYNVKNVNEKVREFQEIDLYLRRVYEGDKFLVEEYIITAKKEVYLDEGAFIPYVRTPLALSIVKPSLKAGESTRLFVVRLRED